MSSWIYIIQRDDEIEYFHDVENLWKFLQGERFDSYQTSDNQWHLLKDRLAKFNDDMDEFEELTSFSSIGSLPEGISPPESYKIIKKYPKNIKEAKNAL